MVNCCLHLHRAPLSMSNPHIWILISLLSLQCLYPIFTLSAFTADILLSAQRQTFKITHIKPQTRQHSAIEHPNLQVSQIPNPFSKLEIKAGLYGDKGIFSTACGKRHSLLPCHTSSPHLPQRHIGSHLLSPEQESL